MRVAALDVGGTKIVGALFDAAGMSGRVEAPTPVVDGRADPGAAVTREVLERLVGASGGVDALGVSVCEYVDGGRVTSREVLGWPAGIGWLTAGLAHVPVVVESDVRCGALAEVTHGVLRGARSAYFVSWGTGLSGCLVEAGRVVTGAQGRAIALGELLVDGRRLEDLASGAGLAQRYREASGLEVPGAREVVVRAAADEAAREVLVTAGRALADGVAVVTRLLDPGLVVVGGGLGSADTPAFEALGERLAGLVELGLPPVDVAHGALGPDGPLVGAAVASGWAGSLEPS